MICRATSSSPSSRAWPCCGASVGTSVGSRIGVDMEAGYLLHAPAQVVEQVDAGDQAEEAAAVGAAVRSEEHTSELQSLMRISSAVFCLKKRIKRPARTD